MQKNLGASIYNFFFALSASIVGAIVFSWPLLFIFVTVQNLPNSKYVGFKSNA